MRNISFNRTSHKVITPQGGLNTETSKFEVPPGQMIGCSNVELADPLGWGKSKGFEPFDGKTRPHLAEFTVFEAAYASDAIAGLEFTSSGGAAGRLLADYDSSSEEIWLYVASGTLSVGETITVSATTICTMSQESSADTAEEAAAMTTAAILAAIGYVEIVPGDGAICGVWSFNGKVFAFRVDGSETKMYGSSTSGWDQVAMPVEIPFDTGSAAVAGDIPSAGNTVTNGTATADVVAVQKTNGAVYEWVSGDAAGIITVKNITGGTFSDTDTLTFDVGTTTAVATGDQEQVALNPDGRYEFDNYNFSGSANTLMMYGVDGANFAFQFDGTDYVQIRTGLEDDTPTHLFMLNYQMFVSKYGSWLLSALGDPLDTWENIRGSDEWAMGDEIVGAITTPGGTTLSIARNSVSIIYPDAATGYYTIKPYTNDYGGVEWSLQNALYPVLLSDGGLILIPPTDKFGDFESNTVDQVVKDLIIGLRESFSCSVVFRNKKEYRMFFTNGTCLRLKFGADKIVGFSVDEYPIVVRGCTASVRSDRYLTDTDIEKDHVFFYSDDGYIRQMDAGELLDGEDMYSYLELPWNHMGAPRVKKRWYDVILEIESGDVGVEIGVKPVYDMFDPLRSEVLESIIEVSLPGGVWSEVNWSEFYWSSSPEGGLYKVRLRGVSPGVGLIIVSRGGGSWNIRSINTRYSVRGEVR